MTRNEQRFGIIGTIGNGSELRPVPRIEPKLSYHTESTVNGEIAIRYSRDYAWDASVNYIIREHRPENDCVTVCCKQILLQEAA